MPSIKRPSVSAGRWPVLVCVLLTLLVPLAAGPAGAATANVSISNVTISPEQPSPGELVTVSTTIRNAGSGSESVEINSLYVRRADSSEDIARVEDLGTITPGTTTTVPLTLSFERAGVKDLRITTVGRTENDSLVKVTYPRTVVVSEGGAGVAVDIGNTNDDGETTVTVNVTNGEEDAYRDLELVVNGSGVSVDEQRRLAARLQSGSSRTFTYTAEFTPDASSTVSATLRYETAQGERRTARTNRTVESDRVETPYDGQPQLETSVETASPGTTRSLNVTVANGLDSDVRQVNVTVASESVEFERTDRVRARLAAGTNHTFRFPATVSASGSYPVNVTLAYTDDGERKRIERTVRPNFEAPARGRPQMQVAVGTAVAGATRPLNVTVANGLDSDVRQVNVTVASGSVEFGVSERVRARLAAGTNLTLRYPATVSEPGTHPVNVTLAYTDDGVRKRVVRTFRPSFDEPANPGEVELTSVEAVQRGDQLEVSATAGNVGSDTVTGVVVSVNDSERVDAANYFVGSVEGSDFATFTLTTTATGNVSAVPVEVTYVVGGVERSFTRRIPVQQASTGQPVPESGGGGGPPVLAIAGVVVALLVVAGLGYRWRR